MGCRPTRIRRYSSVTNGDEPSGVENLAREGFPRTRCVLVGNPMIDALRHAAPAIEARALVPTGALLVTLHRPSNVDDPRRLARWCRALRGVATIAPVSFPVHPRTRARLVAGGLVEGLERAGVTLSEPLGYLDFVAQLAASRAVMTDSGGIQEEAAYLGVPCLTLRTTTERPLTLTHGTNRLVGDDPDDLAAAVRSALRRPRRSRFPRRLWDGHAADRIVRDLHQQFV